MPPADSDSTRPARRNASLGRPGPPCPLGSRVAVKAPAALQPGRVPPLTGAVARPYPCGGFAGSPCSHSVAACPGRQPAPSEATQPGPVLAQRARPPRVTRGDRSPMACLARHAMDGVGRSGFLTGERRRRPSRSPAYNLTLFSCAISHFFPAFAISTWSRSTLNNPGFCRILGFAGRGTAGHGLAGGPAPSYRGKFPPWCRRAARAWNDAQHSAPTAPTAPLATAIRWEL